MSGPQSQPSNTLGLLNFGIESIYRRRRLQKNNNDQTIDISSKPKRQREKQSKNLEEPSKITFFENAQVCVSAKLLAQRV